MQLHVQTYATDKLKLIQNIGGKISSNGQLKLGKEKADLHCFSLMINKILEQKGCHK